VVPRRHHRASTGARDVEFGTAGRGAALGSKAKGKSKKAKNLFLIFPAMQPRHLSNQPAQWGPWAGKIITGDEAASPPVVYSVAADGTVGISTPDDLGVSPQLGIRPEDFDVIQAGQDLYCTLYNGSDSQLLKISRNYFTNYIGDLLITQAGENATATLFIVHWDRVNCEFNTRSLVLPSSYSPGRFEHVSFAPINLPEQ
jgi:hypothetical protein